LLKILKLFIFLQLHFTIWWNIRLLIIDTATNKQMTARSGPQLPCGMGEMPTTLAPGESHTKQQGVACTQPIGAVERVGWQFDALPRGRYRVYFVFRSPPPHGFGIDAAHVRDGEWRGLAVSNELEYIVE
jgi:hypothetical protein